MFTGILIGGALAFWIYMIFFRYKSFDSEAFKGFMLCSGGPFILWLIYKML
ncbi:hypothetical protein [Phytobacter sp. AG2a]